MNLRRTRRKCTVAIWPKAGGGTPSVVARIQPANVASAQVAAALGLARELDTSDRFGRPVRIHRVHNLGQGAGHAPHG
jgi:hypothetical protein